jgi:DNA/RNA endonuclease YhcR with UshA esterase domain
MTAKFQLVVLTACLLFAPLARSQETAVVTEPVETAAVATITSLDATNHIGKTATVCGTVTQTRFMSDSLNKYTFINLDGRYPDEPFCIIIEQPDRINFSEPPEITYRNKKVCVTGLIEKFKSKAQIKVKNPSQIKIEEAAAE